MANKKKIAIVGMACRFPGEANSPAAYWELLKNATDAVSEISSDRWDKDFYQHTDKKTAGKSYTFSAGILSNIDQFDAAFFGISPREAAQMDPQQRLLLELTWEALEDAGQIPAELSGSNCAVIVGIASTDYLHRRMDDLSSFDPYSMLGNTVSIASNRISYILNVKGPSFSVDTACSSSLVAINQACQTIWSGDSSTAIAAGVNLLLHPFGFIGFSKASMLSPRKEGRCRAFDDSGDGYVRAEGCAALYLKPLDQAEADGDNIHAVILGSAINSDGKTKGLTVPSTEAQAALLKQVYSQAGVNSDELDYLEAHGTGTAVGDPLEAAAITQALSSTRSKPLPIGSAKTNVGHLETASGMAGIFKVILSLKHQAIPPSLHFETPNKNIDFKAQNIYVVDQLTPLKGRDNTLKMGVNSFGFGGANAHIVLEEYQATSTKTKNNTQHIIDTPPLFLSAYNPKALQAMAKQYIDLIQHNSANMPYANIANSTYHHRQQLNLGLCVHGKTPDDIIKQLEHFTHEKNSTQVVSQQKLNPQPKLALVFSGNGSQWQGMGCELLKTEPIFRQTVEHISDLLAHYYVAGEDNISLIDVFEASPENSQLDDTKIAQPLLFALQVGLVNVLKAHGIQPEAVIGHSVGEVAAAWACNALSLEQAVQVIYQRSQAQGKTKGSGRMAAIAMGDEAFNNLLNEIDKKTLNNHTIAIAGINSPHSITVSSTLETLEQLSTELAQRSIRHKILELDYAFHSHHMDIIKQEILDNLQGLNPHTAKITFASTVNAKLENGEQLNNQYWWDNIRQPVRFAPAIDQLVDQGFRCFIEIGPHPIMRGYINECLRDRDITGMVIPTIQKDQESLNNIKSAAYSTYLAGCRFDAIHLVGEKRRYTPLPNYPWQHERHWYPLTSEGYDLVNRKREHPLLGYRLKDAEAQWENIIDTTLFPYLADHVVDGGVILPAAAYIEMALAASKSWFNKSSHEIENIDIHAPIVLDHTKTVRFNLLADDGSFKISSRDRLSKDPWTINVTGRLMGHTARKPATKIDIKTIKTNSQHNISRAGHYLLTTAVGLDYGEGFQGIEQVWINTHTQYATAQLRIDDSIKADFKQYILHPSLLDAGFQLLVDVFSTAIDSGKQAALIPVQMGKLYHYQATDTLSYLQLQIKKQSPQSVVADFILYNQQGECLAELRDCRFRAMQLNRSQHSIPSSYTFQAQLMPLYATTETAPITDLASIKKAVLTHFSKQDNAARQHHYKDILPLFDAVSSMFAWQALKPFDTCHTPFSIKQLCKQEHIDNAHLPLLQRMLSILEQDELASQTSDGLWILATSADLPDAEAIWLAILGDSSAYIAELIMLGRCGMHLTDVLQGRLSAEEIFFAAKSSIKSHWYSASPSYTHINNGLCESISHLVKHWPENKRMRILQLGGGDASLTQQLLPLLPTDQTDYLFSDSNTDALSNASFELADYTFLTTTVLDIESSLSEQLANQAELAYHSYDIIIAANTLHQCHHLDNALKNISQLLAPKGLLLLLENQPDRFTDLTFGINPSWWIHIDHKGQAISSLLTITEWQQHISDTGFDNITLLQEPMAIEETGAFIIIADTTAIPVINDKKGLQDSKYIEQTSSELLPKQPSWLIFHDSNTLELACTLQAALQEKQQTVNLAETLNSQTVPADPIIDNIIHLAGLNEATSTSISTILALQQKRCLSMINLAQQLDKNQTECTLWFISRNAAVIDQSDNLFRFKNTPEQASLWGLGRVLMNEHPALQSFMIDLQLADPTNTHLQSSQLVAEFLYANPNENEIILSENARHVMRMRKKELLPAPTQTTSPPHFGLTFKTSGPLKNLYWQTLPSRTLKANEIEIYPLATGLNFRDVMYAMGLLSDEAVENGFAGPTLGMELAGKVINIGTEVTDFNIGDEVIGFAPACFSSRVITETTAIAHKPEAWNYQEAATVPTTFFTVYYSLHHLAQLAEGDKILIHGASGGVGIAAIQYARYCGAEIFATAGSDEKRDFVRLMGADHILDSRSLNFADDIMAITNGEGVDIILNSLAGEAINRNLAILKPFGRFLELGKRDFYQNSKIGLRPFRNNISYFGIDADQLLVKRPALASRLFKEMMSLFNEGILRPLPYRTFPATRIADAFRYMQQSKHIGKVIVSFEGKTPTIEIEAPKQKALQCDPNGNYLITGGLSGFGLKTAQWLTEKGARNLILISRGGKANDEAAKHISALSEQGITVATHACDVTDEQALQQLLSQIPAEKPLKGLIHAAMVLDDGLIKNMSTTQFNSVISPKVGGAWHLHQLTASLNLEFFVLYSSATTFMGNPGQANYVAANMFLESLAHYRHSKQLPATYAAWGAIDDVGFLARNEETKKALQSRLGGKPLHSDHALAILEKLIVNQHIGAAIIDFDWNTIQRLMPSARTNKYEQQLHQCSSSSEQIEDIHTLIADKNPEEVQALISTMLMSEIAQILRIPAEKLDTHSSIFDLGMDSLMGMELVLAIEERFSVKLPVMALTEGANIKRIAERISEQLIGNDAEEYSDTDKVNRIASQHGVSLSADDAKKLSATVTDK